VNVRLHARVAARACALAATAVLASCTPLFLPPVPHDALTPAPAWRLAGDGALRAASFVGGPRLRVRFRFDAVPHDAWVSVQWFGPAGGERASAAVWVARADEGRTFAIDLPADVPIEPGAWRALLSVDGQVLRQFDVIVPAAP
jgi:hypothetical protein